MRGAEAKSISLYINGRVQGVGFRPFVYTLANELGVKGTIKNSGEGVVIEAESEVEIIEEFSNRIRSSPPASSRIDSFQSYDQKYHGFEGFAIVHSETDNKSTAVPEDMGMCESCTKEFEDPTDRRKAYWAISCTDCGPRYSITKTLPYDRVNTSMDHFKMCPACEKEYQDPQSRRFHAQAISCHECGPRLRLLGPGAKVLNVDAKEIIKICAASLKEGKIIALKGIGGFHLVCDATDDKAVQQLRKSKRRPAKPFAVMFKDVDEIDKNTVLDEEHKRWIRSSERPIVIVEEKEHNALSRLIAPGLKKVGVFLPYTALHRMLLAECGRPLVLTSANHSNTPIITDTQKLLDDLPDVADRVIDHDREIVNAIDDSVMQLIDKRLLILRNGRGFSPSMITLKRRVSKPILALGAHQKSTLAIAFDDKLILSPYIGDLQSVQNCEHFERVLGTFKELYDFEPELLIHDKHPDYYTSGWAKRQGIASQSVQHHHAHILACMAEYEIVGPVLGFSFDGTGYGEEGSLWGGEVMIADVKGYERIGALMPFGLIGADKAIKEPRRMGLTLMFECFELEELMEISSATRDAFSEEEIRALHQAWKKGLNMPLCSSVGRLFDAVASLCGVTQMSTYEGESGLKLEALFDPTCDSMPYRFEYSEGKIEWRTMIKEIVCEEDKTKAITRFFHTLVEIVEHYSNLYPEFPVVLSGGVFQNSTLLELVLRRFEQLGRTCLVQQSTPVNDSGIALGQAWYAIHKG